MSKISMTEFDKPDFIDLVSPCCIPSPCFQYPRSLNYFMTTRFTWISLAGVFCSPTV